MTASAVFWRAVLGLGLAFFAYLAIELGALARRQTIGPGRGKNLLKGGNQ